MALGKDPRYLFVGTDPTWRHVAAEAAARCGAAIDIKPDTDSALGWMLPPRQVYDVVMAVGPVAPAALDALAGMLDEVTFRPTPLLLLGCETSGTAMDQPCVNEPDIGAMMKALARLKGQPAADRGALQPADLGAALHAGGLRMRFQPILRAADRVPIGLEALVRLHHGARGVTHPKDFLPLAVSAGRERVLASVIAARTFLEIGRELRHTGLFVTVNLPLATVMHDSSVRRGLELCGVAGVTPGNIMIEVLETYTAPDLDRLGRALTAWREAGFRTAIDDAGPALPHWRDLLDLPFDTLKLDGMMVADPAQSGLLSAIMAAARRRGLFTVAEGIEDEACLARVLSLGVDGLQGFLFSRPLPSLAVPIWLRHWRAREEVAA